MTALSLEAYDGLDGSRWNVPAKPEPAVCRSSFPHPQTSLGWALCEVDHREMCTPVHGAMVNGQWFTWSTRAAAAAWSAVNTCAYSYCPQIVAVGQAYCSTRCSLLGEHGDDNRDDVEEAAA